MHTHSASDVQSDGRQPAYDHRPPLSSPATLNQPHVQFTSPNYLREPPPSSAQGQDEDIFAYLPPTLTTASTSASSSLPVTPATPADLGRFSTGRSYQPGLPYHREEDEPQSAGLSSTFQFAFRPPSEPVSEPLSPFGRAGLATAASSAPSSSGTGLGAQWIPLSSYSSHSYEYSKKAGLSAPSTPGSYSEKTKAATPSVGGSEKTVTLFDEVRGVHVQETVQSVAGSNDEEDEDSPFPEVRASVSNVDDPDMPCLTFRMWFVGITICLMLSAANMFFYLRNPAPYWSGPVGVILAWIGGKLLEKILPIRLWTVAGYEFSLNPGPFNIKEHTLMYMLGGLILEANMAPYAMSATVVWEKRYHQGLNTGFMFVLSSQILGFGLVGLCHRLLVWPASAIWPTTLATCATLNALHAGDDAYSRHKGPRQVTFFGTVAVAAGVWAFFPGYIFTALSYFSFFCWIFPKNVIVNQLFGVVSGLGMNVITFDWTQITMAPSPLTTPFWAQLHSFGAFVLFYWIVGPILYYTNVWKSAHLPIFGGMAYDRFAQPYDVTRVLNLETLKFNSTAYDEYSPVYLPISFALTYLLAFVVPPAILVHTILVYWPKISAFIQRKAPKDEPDDIHAKLMRRYPAIPWWWYGTVFIVSFALSIGSMKVQPELELPVLAILLAILLAVIWIIPVCYVSAISGLAPAVNLIAQIIPGALWQERPFVNMVFKVYVVQGLSVGGVYVRAFKLGHYMKIPPRYGFMVQAVGIIVTTFIQLCIKSLIFAGVQDICQPNQSARLVCAQTQVFYSASIIWGLIGPRRQFGKEGVYYGEIYALTAGAMLPLLIWGWCQFRPKSPLRKFNIPVALSGCTNTPPATGINYSSAFAVGLVFPLDANSTAFLPTNPNVGF
ncbi:hypothetical protein M407DRAFT_21995 [Tulasnella calospora MUT 4182]|uniref:Uncharacterized protein n=1 Tax=Tulasnella calospora MUT 4182 TaxID=1051891 RepID=A0A0C3QDB7_9AGAM|nr:hypothetical protein M407DRAFT_21995 [Tulasnella calospora MUT 4182]